MRQTAVMAMVALALAGAAFMPARAEVAAVMDLSGKGGFFDLPFPSELRRESGGGIEMADFPNRWGLKMIERSKDSIASGYGFSTAPTIYFRFTGPINESNLPAVETSREPSSPIFILDIDPNSPERGRRFPLWSRFYHDSPALVSHAHNLLALMPAPGFVLRENTLYAAGVMRSLGAKKGALGPSPSLASLLAGKDPGGKYGPAAVELYPSALASLRSLGVAADDLAALTVFRTGDPTRRLALLFEGVKKLPPLEFETPLQKTREYEAYTVLEGVVLMPQFQDGSPPYGHGRGGRIQMSAAGEPVVQRLQPVPVVFTVPKGEMPAAGFPILIYIHGTAGVSTQVVDRGVTTEASPMAPSSNLIGKLFAEQLPAAGEGPALILAARGIAAAAAAQPLSGQRGGMDQQLTFYNFLSPEALRDNVLQAALEAAMLLRLAKAVEISPALCPGTNAGAGPVRFNPKLIFGMGQSLGSLILGPWGAVETDLKALIPAGNGAYWSLFMAKGNPLDMKGLKKKGQGLTESLGLDVFHPVIMALSTVLAEADPFAYQGHYLREPLPGRAPKNVWASFGLYDHYFYPGSQNAAILCMDLDFIGPVREPSTEAALELAGLHRLDYPARANRGNVTAVAVQFEEIGPLDGHHVNYQRDDAKYQYGCFLESLVKKGEATAFAPQDRWNAPCGP